jgi:hypothetical protein
MSQRKEVERKQKGNEGKNKEERSRLGVVGQ